MTDPKQIASYAADVVERTQLTSNISSRPDIMNGSEGKRLFTDFSTIPLMLHGLYYEQQARNSDASALTRNKALAYTLLTTAAIPSLLSGIMTHPGKLAHMGDSQQKQDDYLKDMAAEIAAESLSVKLPIAGRNAVDLLFKKGDEAGVAPALRNAKSLYYSRSGLGKVVGANDKPLTTREINAMIDNFTMITGIPASAANHVFKGLKELSQ